MAFTNKPSVVKWKNYSFVIMDAPNDANVHVYLKELQNYKVTDIVRACEPTYATEQVQAAGIHVHEFEFQDGESPPKEIIDKWLALVKDTFQHNTVNHIEKSIAVHCVAGLGRAPVLVAIALIENGFDPINAVEHIRKCRRGAINLRQLKYLEKYQPTTGGQHGKCCIM